MIDALFQDKGLKPKARTEQLSQLLLHKAISVSDLIGYARLAKDSPKATCMEALEFATRQDPEQADNAVWILACASLSSKAPRVKWESAKVIGNIAHRFPQQVDEAIVPLLNNAELTGTVVRWSAAFALCAILRLKTKRNKELVPAIEAILASETNNAVRKQYQAALKAIL
jgi:hypothetical protein